MFSGQPNSFGVRRMRSGLLLATLTGLLLAGCGGGGNGNDDDDGPSRSELVGTWGVQRLAGDGQVAACVDPNGLSDPDAAITLGDGSRTTIIACSDVYFLLFDEDGSVRIRSDDDVSAEGDWELDEDRLTLALDRDFDGDIDEVFTVRASIEDNTLRLVVDDQNTDVEYRADFTRVLSTD